MSCSCSSGGKDQSALAACLPSKHQLAPGCLLAAVSTRAVLWLAACVYFAFHLCLIAYSTWDTPALPLLKKSSCVVRE